MHAPDDEPPQTLDTGPVVRSADGGAAAGLSATRGADPHATRVVDALAAGTPAAFHAEGFDILAEVGRGGMGVVYRARDRRRDQVVALKTLPHLEPTALLRFKQEFRTLADVTHPNLVALYEMISDGAVWFFTMEFIEGVDFLTHCRAGGEAGWAPARERRLRDAFGQLALGVQALHDAGKLHRDLKARNVLVTPQGRVVILDFGLAVDLGRRGVHESADRHLLGTIPYMSPEQAVAAALGPASDWYSFGVMLFEALTGRLPYASSGFDILREKAERDPPPPRAFAPDVPRGWDALCAALLQRDAAARPVGADVLRFFGVAGAGTAAAPAHPGAAPLVGRREHLRALADAFEAVRGGRTAVALLAGPSGSGKSTLAQHFLDELTDGAHAVVLAGQCYQQETVPFKAFDSLVDALSRHLEGLADHDVEVLLPRDADALARLFPVLGRVAALAARRRGRDVPDPRELRRRAFAALRELLARLGDRRPLVLHIDDLQWGDADSLALLTELLRPPDPPVLLLLGCYRSEEAATSPFLQGLLSARDRLRDAAELRELAVEPLGPDESRELARALLGASAGDLAEVIARESGGSPLFIQELAQQRLASASHEPAAAPGPVSLDTVLWRRVERLPDDARQLLAVLVIAGRPVAREVACRAAGLEADPLATVARLRSQRLVRGTGPAAAELLAVYHDRVREAVAARIGPVLTRDCHRRLVAELEAAGGAEPEDLAVHYEGAGDPARAAGLYAQAARRAADGLAFDHAARLYRKALELGRPEGEEARRLRERLGDALANAGRGADAARAYLDAAQGAPADEALDLRRKAAGQYLVSGRVAEGVALARDVLAAVGLSWPATPNRALLALLGRRLRLRLRGLGFRERPAAAVAPDQLRRIDTTWAIATGLASLDVVRGAYFQATNLLDALRAGEPFRVARALGVEAGHLATAGTAGAAGAEAVLQAADSVARRLNDPQATGLVTMATGVVRYLTGHWRQAEELCAQAEELFREHSRGATWELNTAQAFRLYALLFQGRLGELARRLPAVMKEAQDRGDLFAFAHLGTFIQPLLRLAEGNAAAARRELDEVVAVWPPGDFLIPQANALLRQCEIDLYGSGALSAFNRVEQAWPAYSRSLILRIQHMRMNAYHLRGRVAVAVALAGDPRHLATAERYGRRLMREGRPDAAGLGKSLLAAAAVQRGRRGPAADLLEAAVADLAKSDTLLFAAAARRQLGKLLGGERGAALLRAADEWMTAEGVHDPARLAAVLIPGFPA